MADINKEDENNKREESRACIKKTHDMVITLTANLSNYKEDFDKHEIVEGRVFDRIFDKLASHVCPKEETVEALEETVEVLEETVEVLVTRTKEQNGHLRDLATGQIEANTKIQSILNIAEGRKSLLREASIVSASVIGGCGLISGIVFGVLKLLS